MDRVDARLIDRGHQGGGGVRRDHLPLGLLDGNTIREGRARVRSELRDQERQARGREIGPVLGDQRLKVGLVLGHRAAEIVLALIPRNPERRGVRLDQRAIQLGAVQVVSAVVDGFVLPMS